MNLKYKSIGFLLGRLIILCYKVEKELKNHPDYHELADEARMLINRWGVEQRIKPKYLLTTTQKDEKVDA
jgi:hypothetical protein